ncbi:hypothetical protein L3556_15215 [Candidatus Synechococcus calcipolaris G9]|uniref:Uncharacterized protein n=1 Tax=Candidatus Synechococcus calcipolaris G9 TaxID=1497997 RepID=A0ABT6F319_9SYNE|nr:hypothetical protein [Candidatus Synechococcus calcipolaris]MDG2992268.1 hypothetical protein [Candidatus Synechococcus calcipolaris G9]
MTSHSNKILLKQGSLVLRQCKKALAERDMTALQQQARMLQVAAAASEQTLIEAEARLLEQVAHQGQLRRAADILMKIKERLVAIAGEGANDALISIPDVPANAIHKPAAPGSRDKTATNKSSAKSSSRPFVNKPGDESYTKRLGNYLVEAELLSPAQIEVALADQRMTGARLGDILVARGWLRQGTIEFIMERVVLPDRRLVTANAQPQSAKSRSRSPESNMPGDRSTLIDVHHPTHLA